MKKYLWIVIVIIVIIVGIVVFSPKNTPVGEKQTVKIGLSLPLTGDLAFMGEGAKEATQLAIENFGPTKHNYEFIYEDDQFSGTKAVTTINKLISIDKINAVVSAGSPAGNTIAPITEKNKIIHFGVASDQNVAKGDYNFIHWTPPSEESKVLISELLKRNLKRVVLFEMNQPGVLAFTSDFKERIKGSGIEIVSIQGFNPGEKDFKSYISKAKTSNGDIYLLEATSPEIEILTQQVRDAGITKPLTSVESFEFSSKPELFEGLWFVGPAASSDSFNKMYNDKYGKNPPLGAPNVYDIIGLIMTGAEKTDKITPENLLTEVNKIKDYKGALGVLNIDKDGLVISQAIIKMIKNGKPIISTN